MENKVYYGSVVWFSAELGIGFITYRNDNNEPQKDMFCHYSDINCDGFRTLKKDQRVSFSIGTNNKGQPKAINVTSISTH